MDLSDKLKLIKCSWTVLQGSTLWTVLYTDRNYYYLFYRKRVAL